MTYPIKDFVTQRAAVGYDKPYGNKMKDLASGSAFHIYGYQWAYGKLWVKSGLGHWYEFISGTSSKPGLFAWRGRYVYLSNGCIRYSGVLSPGYSSNCLLKVS